MLARTGLLVTLLPAIAALDHINVGTFLEFLAIISSEIYRKQ